jgi:PAS domain S-box-containing protein
MNADAILSVIAIIVNIELGLFVISRGPRLRVNRIFLGITSLFTIWGIGELVTRAAGSAAIVLLGARISAFGWAFIGSVFVHFALAVTNRERLLEKWWTYALIYAPGAVLLVLTLATHLIYIGFGPGSKGFPEISGSLRLYSKIFVFVMLFIGIAILVSFWRKTSDPTARERAGFIIIAALVPMLGGVVTDVIIPAVNVRQPVNALTLSTITAAIIAFAVTRRGIMSTRLAAVGGTIITMMLDPVFILDASGSIETVNPMAVEFTGYAAGELRGSTMDKLIADEDGALDLARKISGSDEASRTAELVVKSGERVPVVVSSGPLVQHAGKQIGSVVLVHDMRETLTLIRAEEEAKLAVIEADIQRRHSEELRDIIDVAAHELRHPATVFKGYANILTEFWEKLDRKRINESLDAIDKTADRLTKLASTLIDASFIESGSIQLEYCDVQPLRLIEESVEKVRAWNPDTEFVYQVGLDNNVFSADMEKMQVVLAALLDNAVKFSPEGSPVDIWFERTDGDVVFSVADRGCGVPPEHRERIFERFYQVEDTLHHSSTGMGLGLYVAKMMIDSLNGWITVEDRSGGGTVFSFGVPATASTRQAVPPIPEALIEEQRSGKGPESAAAEA